MSMATSAESNKKRKNEDNDKQEEVIAYVNNEQQDEDNNYQPEQQDASEPSPLKKDFCGLTSDFDGAFKAKKTRKKSQTEFFGEICFFSKLRHSSKIGFHQSMQLGV
ncbi:unnamed protein product [Didymodactylos carnosus]|uniref:Uncharacterized protein n=1 Tax=Didymodactylos carnosus TaxID=1234261 RepID=A0A816DES1_9BILA|nr:unnamed protein product [Didymodactylos carnosus]CAF4539981.1 unnamed protein product [Didymodactylos carnosus]